MKQEEGMAEYPDRESGVAEAERIWNSIEPELRPFVDRSITSWGWRRRAVEARKAARWREWRSEPLPRLGGDELLDRTAERLREFWRGDHSRDDSGAGWPLSARQCDAIRDASAAESGSERLRAIAGLLEVSAYFDWHASREALLERKALVERESEYFSERFYQAFKRPDLAAGTYTKVNVGLIGPKEAPIDEMAPRAICADATGWTAVLWGHARNRWGWVDTEPYLFSSNPRLREHLRRIRAERESGEWIEIKFPVVGVSFFTSLREVDGLVVNAAAARLLELDEQQVQWLGASAWEGGPCRDRHVTGRDMAEVCRAVAGGEDARDAWYARRVRDLRLTGDPESRRARNESDENERRLGPRFPGRLSALIGHTVGVGRRLDPGVYRPSARVLHRWNASLERCELDLAGMVLAGTLGISPRAKSDEVWGYLLEDLRTEHPLQALRQLSLGDVAGAVSTLGWYEEERRHRRELESMVSDSMDFEGWSEAEAHFRNLEALARRLEPLGL